MKKKKKTPFILRFIRWWMPKLDVVFPSLAKKWMIKLFFTPMRTAHTHEEESFIKKCTHHTIRYKQYNVNVYQLGDNPSVLFVHGWAGRGAQGMQIMEALYQEGINSVTFDLVGHGNTDGKQTNIMEVAEVILMLEKKYNRFRGVVGHSMGGVSTVFTKNRGLQANRIALIAVPGTIDFMLETFITRINASKKMRTYLEQYITTHFDITLESLDASLGVQEFSKNTHVVVAHDQKDKEAPIALSRQLQQNIHHSEMIMTKGWGHNRILTNPQVIEAIVALMKD